MPSADPSQEEIAAQLLEQMRLLKVARGGPKSVWLVTWEKFGSGLFMAAGGALLVQGVSPEAFTNLWMFFGGALLVLLSRFSLPDMTAHRLDALLRFLDDSGRLAPECVDEG